MCSIMAICTRGVHVQHHGDLHKRSACAASWRSAQEECAAICTRGVCSNLHKRSVQQSAQEECAASMAICTRGVCCIHGNLHKRSVLHPWQSAQEECAACIHGNLQQCTHNPLFFDVGCLSSRYRYWNTKPRQTIYYNYTYQNHPHAVNQSMTTHRPYFTSAPAPLFSSLEVTDLELIGLCVTG